MLIDVVVYVVPVRLYIHTKRNVEEVIQTYND